MLNTEYLYSLLTALPPNLKEIENELQNNNYSSEEVTLIACNFCEECFCEYTDFIEEHNREPLEHEIHTSYVYDICKLLLEYGLNPNLILGEKYSETNIMYEVYWITKPYVAADVLKLLLEYGGNPMLLYEDKPFYNMVDFDISFDITEGYYIEDWYKIKFDCRFHFWLVLLAAVAEEGAEEKKYIHHEDYIPVITKRDEHQWDIGVQKANK